MPFALTKPQRDALDTHARQLKTLRATVEDEFKRLTDTLDTVATPVNAAIRQYNAALDAFITMANDIAEEHRNAFEERSERWQESDAGQAALAFVEAWEDIQHDHLDLVDVLPPDNPVAGSMDLDALPVEAE